MLSCWTSAENAARGGTACHHPTKASTVPQSSNGGGTSTMEQRCVCRCAGTMTWLGLILALLRRRQPVMAPCKRYTLFCVALPWYGTLIARQTEPRIGSGPANSMAGSRSWAEVQTSKDDRSNPRLGWRRARHGTARPWPDGGQEHAPQGPRTRPRMGTACGRERPGPWPAWTAQPYSPCKGGGGWLDWDAP